MEGNKLHSHLSLGSQRYLKYKQSHPGTELRKQSSFHAMITVSLQILLLPHCILLYKLLHFFFFFFFLFSFSFIWNHSSFLFSVWISLSFLSFFFLFSFIYFSILFVSFFFHFFSHPPFLSHFFFVCFFSFFCCLISLKATFRIFPPFLQSSSFACFFFFLLILLFLFFYFSNYWKEIYFLANINHNIFKNTNNKKSLFKQKHVTLAAEELIFPTALR